MRKNKLEKARGKKEKKRKKNKKGEEIEKELKSGKKRRNFLPKTKTG